MQTWIRTQARKECRGVLDERVLVAEDVDTNFGAVVAHARCEASYRAWIEEQAGWSGPLRLLRVVAVATTYQGTGLGRRALERALDDVVDRESDQEVLVLAVIDDRNKRSEGMVKAQGFDQAPFPCQNASTMRYWFTVA
ncbi:GNAT family N-acetyltransferase [Streptomyces sp. NPDC020422]|uniref:GNAT family N-acetyltransferase n=1 Tax=Streptomyces sp. NPDC020422 TaxID=3365074 RepID=UPI0037AFDB1A